MAASRFNPAQLQAYANIAAEIIVAIEKLSAQIAKDFETGLENTGPPWELAQHLYDVFRGDDHAEWDNLSAGSQNSWCRVAEAARKRND